MNPALPGFTGRLPTRAFAEQGQARRFQIAEKGQTDAFVQPVQLETQGCFQQKADDGSLKESGE